MKQRSEYKKRVLSASSLICMFFVFLKIVDNFGQFLNEVDEGNKCIALNLSLFDF